MQQETFFSMFQYIVDNLFVELGTQSDRSQRLSFTTSKDSRSVRTRQRANFAPDRANFRSLTTIQTLAFIQNRTTHSFFLYIMIVTVDQRSFLFEFFFRELSLELFADSIKSFETFVLIIISRSSNGISLVIASLTNCLAQFFVVYFMIIFTFHRLSYFFHQLHLSLAMNLDSFVSHLHCFQQFSFGYLVHFTFYHHDVIISSGYHQVHISFFQLIKSRINYKLTIDTCYTYLRNRSVERNI